MLFYIDFIFFGDSIDPVHKTSEWFIHQNDWSSSCFISLPGADHLLNNINFGQFLTQSYRVDSEELKYTQAKCTTFQSPFTAIEQPAHY